jgi:hypothetical protein
MTISSTSLAHNGHHHEHKIQVPKNDHTEMSELTLISSNYLDRIKPIFQKTCFDCHGNQTRFPWYYKIPGIKQLIDSDRAESKEHLDFSNDYPFQGHGTNEEDLKAIADAIRDESMPPITYRILHRDTRISDSEKKLILEWTEASLKTLDDSKSKIQLKN